MLLCSGCGSEDWDPGAIVLEGVVATTANSVTLAWTRTPFDEFYAYHIAYSTTPNFERRFAEDLEILDRNVTRSTVTGLEPEQTYYFRIYVEDDDGEYSPPSNEISAVTSFRPQAVFMKQPVRLTPTSILVTWNPSTLDRFSTYEIAWSTQQQFDLESAQHLTIHERDSTSLIIDNLTPNTIYFFRGYVYDTDGFLSNSSNLVSEPTWTWTEETRLSVPGAPVDVAINEDGARGYVLSRDSSEITRFDPADRTLGDTYSFDAGRPVSILLNDARNELYICDLDSNEVIVLSSVTHDEKERVPVGNGPSFMSLHPNADTLYVASVRDSGLTRIDLGKAETDFFSLDKTPGGIAINPAGTAIYYSGTLDPQIHVFSLTTYERTEHYEVGADPSGVALNYAGSYLFSANYADGTVSVLSTFGQSIIATIEVGDLPRRVAYSHDERQVYITLEGDRKVAVVSPTACLLTELIDIPGADPAGIAVPPLAPDIWVCLPDANELLCIRRSPM